MKKELHYPCHALFKECLGTISNGFKSLCHSTPESSQPYKDTFLNLYKKFSEHIGPMCVFVLSAVETTDLSSFYTFSGPVAVQGQPGGFLFRVELDSLKL